MANAAASGRRSVVVELEHALDGLRRRGHGRHRRRGHRGAPDGAGPRACPLRRARSADRGADRWIDVDLLIAAGCVREVVGCYVGVEGLAAVGPVFRTAVQSGAVTVVDLDEAHCIMGLRAAAHKLPFMPWRGGVGTSLPQLTPSLVEFEDPVAGEPLLAIPAIELDVALIFAERSDPYGNVQFVGTSNMDRMMGAAAERVVVQVERVVSNEVIRRDPERTVYWRDTTVVRAPFGTHPYSSGGMIADEEHLREFLSAAREGETGVDGYLDRYVRGPADHEGYLEQVGVRRLTSLLI